MWNFFQKTHQSCNNQKLVHHPRSWFRVMVDQFLSLPIHWLKMQFLSLFLYHTEGHINYLHQKLYLFVASLMFVCVRAWRCKNRLLFNDSERQSFLMILSELLQTWRKITIKAEWQFYGVWNRKLCKKKVAHKNDWRNFSPGFSFFSLLVIINRKTFLDMKHHLKNEVRTPLNTKPSSTKTCQFFNFLVSTKKKVQKPFFR